MDGVATLFDRFEKEPEHAIHVTRLAMQLFDATCRWHGFDESERSQLEAAALLHDIGWTVTAPTGSGHHKATARLIREYPWPGVDRVEVERIALVARYHRKALPAPHHADYASLPSPQQSAVRRLAAILRVADALDRRHLQRTQSVSVGLGLEVWTVGLVGRDGLARELDAAAQKGDLLQREVERPVVYRTIRPDESTPPI